MAKHNLAKLSHFTEMIIGFVESKEMFGTFELQTSSFYYQPMTNGSLILAIQ